jgi:hypothetical protein
MDFICDPSHFWAMSNARLIPQISPTLSRRPRSDRPANHPGLYLLEIAAALLSVLALRDAILHNALPSVEALSAAILWIAFVAAVCLASFRRQRRNRPL